MCVLAISAKGRPLCSKQNACHFVQCIVVSIDTCSVLNVRVFNTKCLLFLSIQNASYSAQNARHYVIYKMFCHCIQYKTQAVVLVHKVLLIF